MQPHIPETYTITALVFFFIFCVMYTSISAQERKKTDIISGSISALSGKDTLIHALDSLTNKAISIPETLTKSILLRLTTSKKSVNNSLHSINNIKIDSLSKSLLHNFSFKSMVSCRPYIKLNGGYFSYNINYRSSTDTPFMEKGILQHNVYGNMNLSIGIIPVGVNYLIRRSNSYFFRNINDVKIEFDPMQFRANMLCELQAKLQEQIVNLKDTLLEFNITARLNKIQGIDGWINSPDTKQKIVEYNEILAVKGITDIPGQPDSTNKKNEHRLKKEANTFLELYNKTTEEWVRLRREVDSLENLYSSSMKKITAVRNMLNQKMAGTASAEALEQSLKSSGVNTVTIPKKYRWLMNIRMFALGRNQLNYSELSSKNTSLSGINFVYNSWYYVAVAAGTINYRYRDFVNSNNNQPHQYMYMARLGIGKIENTHIIASFYTGRKQLYTVTNRHSGTNAVNISGLTLETKFQINQNSFLTAEAAQSVSPDFRKKPVLTGKFGFSDKSNKALSLRLYSFFPKTSSRIEAMYKFTGANFQSFSSFQSNSQLVAWYVKVDQHFLKRKLKVTAALRSNEFSNPYIIQNYKSNTVFKSIQLTYRARKFPSISLGYIPTSQVTFIDSQLVENHFNSMNVAVTHSYKVGFRKATSAFIYNRFYNNQNDIGFIYYNAVNIFFNQTIAFSQYMMNISVSHSSNNSFELNILDAGLSFNVTKNSVVGFGVKVNDFSRSVTKTGLYGRLQFAVKRLGFISMQYDNGFIPGNNHQFLKNEIMNLNFTRSF